MQRDTTLFSTHAQFDSSGGFTIPIQQSNYNIRVEIDVLLVFESICFLLNELGTLVGTSLSHKF